MFRIINNYRASDEYLIYWNNYGNIMVRTWKQYGETK